MSKNIENHPVFLLIKYKLLALLRYDNEKILQFHFLNLFTNCAIVGKMLSFGFHRGRANI